MKRVWLIVFLASALAAAPPKKPTQDYTSWNNKWFATCQGESFIVDVKVGSPKKPGSHSFDAYFLEGGGICPVGADAPVKRFQFLHGTMTGGKISGTILLCTRSQELVDANGVSAVFDRHFDASYDPKNANITDTKYKGEYYKREDDVTGAKGGANAGGGNKTFQRDEPADPEAAFEMHLYRGPAYDHVTHREGNPGPSPTPPKLGDKAQGVINDVVQDGVHEWMNDFRKWLGADPI
jgi:hypothetical protein